MRKTAYTFENDKSSFFTSLFYFLQGIEYELPKIKIAKYPGKLK